MATNIPPHNLREVIDSVVKIIDNYEIDKKTEIEELLKIIKGPDFPTEQRVLVQAALSRLTEQEGAR